jgi:muramoyltetrapeptide carboxypeptidase
MSSLKGEQLFYEWQTETSLDVFNKHRSITAPIIGGNLSMLYANIGTQSDIDTTGKILFLEDLDEYLYHIDRMMNALQRSGKLNDIAGLLIGGMTDMKDNETPFGKTAPEIIYDYVKDMEIPVAFSFPAGHTEINQALILGCDAEFVVGENSSLKFLNNLTP